MSDPAARKEAERIVTVYQHVHGRYGAPASCPSCRGLIGAIAAALSAAAPAEANHGADGEIRGVLGQWWAEEFSDVTLPTEAMIRLSERLATMRMFAAPVGASPAERAVIKAALLAAAPVEAPATRVACWLVWVLLKSGDVVLRAVDLTEGEAERHQAWLGLDTTYDRVYVERSCANHLYAGLLDARIAAARYSTPPGGA